MSATCLAAFVSSVQVATVLSDVQVADDQQDRYQDHRANHNTDQPRNDVTPLIEGQTNKDCI